VVETAWKLGHPEEAQRLAWALARNKPTSAEGFQLLVSQLPASTPAREAIPIYQEMLESLPDSTTARTELAYQQLLAEENISQAAEIALEAHKKSPNKRSTRHIAALALLRQGEIAQADALYDTLPLLKNAPAANQAIRVAILRKINRLEEAEILAAKINLSQLSPEERALIEKPPEPPLEQPAPDEWNETDEPETDS
jgi:tetratricopeptide (TPR) repeat protein